MRARIAIAAAMLAVLAATPALAAERRPPRDERPPCPEYGPGFARVQGSATCVRVSGRARAEVGTAVRGEAPATTAGRLAIDTRTPTDYGPVRTFIRLGTGRR